MKQLLFQPMQQVILIISILFSSLLTITINAQVPIPDQFKTKSDFDQFIQQLEGDIELGNRSLVGGGKAPTLSFVSFKPTFDESEQLKSIEIEYSDGKRYRIDRQSEQTFTLQKGRKKLRKRPYFITLELGASNSRKSIRLWNNAWSYS